jgi:hypothetical protein
MRSTPLALVTLLTLLLAAPATGQETPGMGGVLEVAATGEPLFTHAESFSPIPMLAEGHTVDNKGRTAARMYFWNSWLAK